VDVPAEHGPIGDSAAHLSNHQVEQSVAALLRAVTILSVEVARLKAELQPPHQSEPERDVRD
jgi:uncharacterized small protein (DUF1192 family)